VNQQLVIDLAMRAIYASAEISVPLLVTALVVGLFVSVFQAATQINEATLSFLPKIVAMVLVLALAAPWMITKMTDFTESLYGQIAVVAREK
jgi:flagellar biosynthetic protein FliQ